jgi:hypothetical protein
MLIRTQSQESRVILWLEVYFKSIRLGDKPLETHGQYFIFQLDTYGYSPYVTSSLMRMGLSYSIAAGPRQHSHSQVQVPRDSWPYFTVSDSSLPQPGGPGPRILYPPGTEWPSYIPKHWVPFSSPTTTHKATVKVFEPAFTGTQRTQKKPTEI